MFILHETDCTYPSWLLVSTSCGNRPGNTVWLIWNIFGNGKRLQKYAQKEEFAWRILCSLFYGLFCGLSQLPICLLSDMFDLGISGQWLANSALLLWPLGVGTFQNYPQTSCILIALCVWLWRVIKGGEAPLSIKFFDLATIRVGMSVCLSAKMAEKARFEN